MISGFLFPIMGLCGARSRNRTGTPVLEATDFKSVVSTYFTTRAIFMEAEPGIEPEYTALQAAA